MPFPLLGILLPKTFVDLFPLTLRSQLKCVHLRKASRLLCMELSSLTPPKLSHVTHLIVLLATISIHWCSNTIYIRIYT